MLVITVIESEVVADVKPGAIVPTWSCHQMAAVPYVVKL